MHEECNVSALIGKTIVSIEGIANSDVTIKTTDGAEYIMYHEQDCCESVSIEDVVGDINDLIGTPILEAEEVSNADDPEDVPVPEYADEAQEWTFYKFGTIKGHVNIRWFGSSNGYYSTGVSFKRTK